MNFFDAEISLSVVINATAEEKAKAAALKAVRKLDKQIVTETVRRHALLAKEREKNRKSADRAAQKQAKEAIRASKAAARAIELDRKSVV